MNIKSETLQKAFDGLDDLICGLEQHIRDWKRSCENLQEEKNALQKRLNKYINQPADDAALAIEGKPRITTAMRIVLTRIQALESKDAVNEYIASLPREIE